jgi:type IV secretion system protein VirD4
MRTDEQIVFTAVNPPLRCGRAIWFRRDDMKACIAENRFEQGKPHGESNEGAPSAI